MKKILIVDDDEDLVDVAKYILAAKGFDVHTQCTGSDVPGLVRRYNPDMILLDIRLYGESGTEICKVLKRRYNIPIVLFSADTKAGEAFADCDADGFLAKPFSLTDLVNTVTLHLKSSNAVA